MDRDAYPFAVQYGWVQDRFGVNWQLIFNGETENPAPVTPTLMFTGNQAGNAEAATKFYTSLFPDSQAEEPLRYSAGEEPDVEGTIKHGVFYLASQVFAIMDSAQPHDFAFNEAVSLYVNCNDQAEFDYYWDALSADPDAEQCGWLKDKYGVSWQIDPVNMNALLYDSDPEKIARILQASSNMKKLDIDALYHAAQSDSI